MPFGNSPVESQRDSATKPRVARRALPWETASQTHNPNGVAPRTWTRDATPLGLKTLPSATQGSSCLATLGWRTQSLWDWKTAEVQGISAVGGWAGNSGKALPLAPQPHGGRCGNPPSHASRRRVSIFWTLFPIVGHAHAHFRPKRDKMAHIVDKITHIAGILAHRAAGTARAVHRMGH